jgi:hypothetical protein
MEEMIGRSLKEQLAGIDAALQEADAQMKQGFPDTDEGRQAKEAFENLFGELNKLRDGLKAAEAEMQFKDE